MKCEPGTECRVALPRATLTDLFPPWVHCAAMDPRRVDPSVLLPQEQALVAQAIDRRRRQFATGRLLARRLMASLGMSTPAPLLRGSDGAPRWPVGIVGSISHTNTQVVVAVARHARGRVLGVDVEGDQPLPEELFSQLCLPAELRWLATLRPREAGRWAKLLFSAKECVYKAQYPRTGRRLDFRDVRVCFDEATGTFEARIRRCAGSTVFGASVSGRYARCAGLVFTALASDG